MREIWFAALVGLAVAWAHPAAAQPTNPGDGALAPTKDDRVFGKPDASITIIEYASLTCPHCAHFAGEVLPKLKEKWIDSGKAKLVLRDFPLDEPALRAAMVARCAPPDRFYTVVDGFFRAQSEWAVERGWQAKLKGVAAILGVKGQQFDTCLADKKLEDQVAQSRLTAATQLGVNSTPTFFINGKKFEGAPTVEAFEQLLSGLADKS
ncbi:MAG TPA: DsbA family protein [Stellaceae bacterium]|jgi:protein-disulfide isomerase|nr:DsbA family protein [Stellaceae bacterium]